MTFVPEQTAETELAAAEATPEATAEASAGAPAPKAAALRHNRNFQLLWVGQVLSDLGSEFGTLAYPLLILYLTRSPVIAGAVGTVTSVLAFVIRLPAGALADRLDRRSTMVACDAVRAVVLAALAVGVAFHKVSWPVVLAAAIIDRAGDVLFGPASIAALPLVVADEQLEGAWAATEARQYAASLGGPALGGLLFSIGRAVPFIGDAVSYGVSSITSLSLRGMFKPPKPEGERKGLWRESFDGIRVLMSDALLRAVIIQAPLINFAFTGMFFTVILGLQRHGTKASVIGLTQAAIMIGGLLGALVAPKLQGRFTLAQLVILLTGPGALLFALAAFLIPSPLVAIPLAIPLVISPTSNAALFAAMLRRTPDGMQGRVNNALIQAATGLAALAPVVAGLLVAHTSAHWALGVFAAALGISGVVALCLKGIREAEKLGATGPVTSSPEPAQVTST